MKIPNNISETINEQLNLFFIRKMIKNTLFEMVENIPHFKDRVYDRLKSPDTNFTQEKEYIRKQVFDNIDFLKSLTIDSEYNMAIFMDKGDMLYKYSRRLSSGKLEQSMGPFVCIKTQGNSLETVVFETSEFRPKINEIKTSIRELKNYIEEVKKGDKTLTNNDLLRIRDKKWGKSSSEVSPEKIKKQTSEFNFRDNKGTGWTLDKVKQIIYKKNNPSISFKAEEVLENPFMNDVDEKIKMDIIDLIS